MKYVFYTLLFLFPFAPVTTGVLFDVGAERAMWDLFLPFGMAGFFAWVIAERKTLPYQIIFGALILFLTIRSGVSFDVWRLVALAGVAFWLAKSSVDTTAAAKIIVITAIIEVVTAPIIESLGLWTNIQNQSGWRGTIGCDNKLASVLLVFIPVAFYLLSVSKGAWRVASWVAIGLLIPAAVLSGSRGGVVGMLIEVVICLLILSRTSKIKWGFVVIGLLAVFSFCLAPDEKYSLGAFTVWGRTEDKLSVTTKAMFVDHPVIGNGAGSWPEVAHRMGLPVHLCHPQSEIGITLAEYGVIGALLLVAFYAGIIALAIERNKYIAVGIGMMLATVYIWSTRTPESTFYMAVMVGLVGKPNKARHG